MQTGIRQFGIGCAKRDPSGEGNLEQGSMGGFMQQMNLPGQTSEDHFNGSQDDLGEWFQGSPQWVRRS